jgi:hypothetical protein
MYARANPEVESAGPIPKWSFELKILDYIHTQDYDDVNNSETAFRAAVEMTFPPHDLPTVVARLKAYNQARNGNLTPGEPGRRQKVNVKLPEGSTESLWAVSVSEGVAIVENIPFLTNEVAWQDLVRVSPSGDFVEVLERLTRTQRMTYEAAKDNEEAARQWEAIRAHFEAQGIVCEPAGPGVFAMAVPSSVTDDEMNALCARCPTKLTPPESPEPTS